MSQDSENWDLLQALFHLAEETPPDERERVLAEHCSDRSLVQQALELIRSSEAFVEKPSSTAAPFKSIRVDSYTLLRPLGSGGIGTVYLAERMIGGVPHRVAIKMLAPHAAGQSFIDRFRREQHILGSLDHPNITRLIDAGLTDSGQQYLVMEYVDGQHINTYCDDRKLGAHERLRIFLSVCEAVAYAHRNLIVHLDLKPSNVLVSKDGVVKLLDFGTSKLIQSDDHMATTTILATPAYSSPEQLRNEPVTTFCDVYSLGAVLFELLTGSRPYGKSSVASVIERAFTAQQAENLLNGISEQGARNQGISEARLRQLLTGDLQTIVQKCLEQRPADRYASVDALAQDVTRYVNGEPILARPQTAIYRLGKFVRRHRTGVAAVGAAALILIGSISYAAWRQEQALREAQRAERMQTFMHQLFRLANSNYTGKPAVTVPEFLQLGVKILPDYIRNPEDLLQAKVALAESTYDNGDLSDAGKIFEETAASARALGDADSEAESEAFAGHIAYSLGDSSRGNQLTADALQVSQRKGVSPAVRVRAADYYAWNRDNFGAMSAEDLRLLRFAADEARRNNLPLHEKADAIHLLANNLEYRGQIDEAQRTDDEALALLKQDPSSICDQSEIYSELADLKWLNLDFKSALDLWQRAYDGYSTCSGTNGRETISVLAYEAFDLTDMGRAPEALRLLEKSRSDWEKLPDPYGRWGAFAAALGNAYVALGRYKEGEAMEIVLMNANQNKMAPWQMGFAEFVQAEALAGEHQYSEALIHAENASKDWSMIPSSITLTPRGYQNLSELKQLRADISAHLSTSRPAPATSNTGIN